MKIKWTASLSVTALIWLRTPLQCLTGGTFWKRRRRPLQEYSVSSGWWKGKCMTVHQIPGTEIYCIITHECWHAARNRSLDKCICKVASNKIARWCLMRRQFWRMRNLLQTTRLFQRLKDGQVNVHSCNI